MIELQVVSLLIGALLGAAITSLYHNLPKKRRGKTPSARPKRND